MRPGHSVEVSVPGHLPLSLVGEFLLVFDKVLVIRLQKFSTNLCRTKSPASRRLCPLFLLAENENSRHWMKLKDHMNLFCDALLLFARHTSSHSLDKRSLLLTLLYIPSVDCHNRSRDGARRRFPHNSSIFSSYANFFPVQTSQFNLFMVKPFFQANL